MKADARYSQLADEELIRLLCDRDVAAFDELYERYVQRLLRYFHRMLAANEEQAQDFLQETFLRVIEKRSSFDPTGRFSTWIFAIAHNLCCNEYRRREVREKAPLEGANFMPVRNVEPDEELQRRLFAESLDTELRRLDENKRSLFLLRFQEGFSVTQISHILNLPVGTIKSRLHNTCRQLAKSLEAFNPKEE